MINVNFTISTELGTAFLAYHMARTDAVLLNSIVTVLLGQLMQTKKARWLHRD